MLTGAQYQSGGSFSVMNVGSGFLCLHSLSSFFSFSLARMSHRPISQTVWLKILLYKSESF